MIPSINLGAIRAKRYWESVSWLSREIWKLFKGNVTVIFILTLASLALRLAAYLVLSKYIHLLESGGALQVPYIDKTLSSKSYELLAISSIACLLLFVGSSLAKYFAERSTLNVMAAYELFCVKRASFGISQYGGHKRLAKWQPHFNRLINADSRMCGVIARMGIRLIMPVAIVISTTCWLLYLDLTLTLILLVLIVACVPILYQISLKGARHSLALEEKGPLATAAKRQLVEQAAQKFTDLNAENDEVSKDNNTASSEHAIRTAIDSFLRRLRATEDSNLLTSLLTACTIFSILLYKGVEILSSSQGWAFIAIYFLVLRTCMGGVTQGASILTAINRMYPQASRYRTFIEQVERLVANSVPQSRPTGKFWSVPAAGGKGVLLDDELD